MFLVYGLVAGIIIGVFIIPPKPATPIGSPLLIPYNDIFRYNEVYVGKPIFIHGRIDDVVYGEGDYQELQVCTRDTSLGYSGDVVVVKFNGERLLKNDIVGIYGRVKGLTTYKDFKGLTETAPEIEPFQIQRFTR